MKNNFRLIFCLALFGIFGFTGCSDLQGVFNGNTQSAQHVNAVKNSSKITPEKPGRTAGAAARTGPAPIVTKVGIYYYVQPGDTIAQIADRYRMDWEDIAEINGLYESELVVGRRLFIPHQRNLKQFVVVSKVITADKTPAQKSAKKIQFAWPVENPRVTSPFGIRGSRPHRGIDIGAKVGAPVFAAENGIVFYAERATTFGNLVVIKHADGYFSAYAHNSKLFVKKGQVVKKGQKISLVGMTGHTKGPHVHFEILQKTENVDPEALLPKIK